MSVKGEIDRIKANVSGSFSTIKNYVSEASGEKNSDTLPAAIRTAVDDVNTRIDQIIGFDMDDETNAVLGYSILGKMKI